MKNKKLSERSMFLKIFLPKPWVMANSWVISLVSVATPTQPCNMAATG